MSKSCPCCGHDEYYKFFTLKGRGRVVYRFDGRGNDELVFCGESSKCVDNGGMYDGFDCVEQKTMYCANCNKPIKTEKRRIYEKKNNT